MSKKKTFEEFLIQAQEKHPNSNYSYDKNTYINTHTPMRIICSIHGEFWQTPKSHLLYECKKCSYEKRAKNYTLTTEEFIEKAKEIHGDKYDYSKSEYKGTKIPILIICPIHGEFWQKPNNHLNGKGCKKCNNSHLERECEKILKQNKINYIFQYKTTWLGKQSLDFYLPDYNIGIECQGKQHFGLGGWYKNYNFKELMQNDIKKYFLCKENNINLIYFSDKIYDNNIINQNNYKNNIFFIKDDLIKKIKG